ncbi:MAG: HAD family phosphatase [Clostridia bacterium]
MINTIIFDIGQVLVSFNWQECFKKHFNKEEFEIASKLTICDENLWNDIDRGAIGFDQLFKYLDEKEPVLSDRIKTALIDVHENLLPFSYANSWVKSMKDKGFKIYILSNYGTDTFAMSQKNFDFLNYIDGKLMSYEVGLIKPDPKIYEKLIEKFSLVPQDCVFFDDKIDNVNEAKKHGINAIHFTNYETAMKEFDLIQNL